MKRKSPLAPFFGATLLLALAAVSDAAPGDESCAASRMHDPTRAVAACSAEARSAEAAGRIDALEDALFQLSDAQLAIGERDAARATLDRVAALPAASHPSQRAFRLHRRRGILAYRSDAFAQALSEFRDALDVARRSGDERSQAQAQNDLGNALRRIGDFRGALTAYLASLEIKRRTGDAQLGPLLNNLGDLYQDLGEPETALQRYREAVAAHEAASRALEATHSRESIAELLALRGDVATARTELERALAEYDRAGVVPGQLRVLAQLAALAQQAADAPAASAWLDRAQARQGDVTQWPPRLLLAQARRLQDGNDAPAAQRLLVGALARLLPEDVDRAAIEDALARSYEASGDTASALAAMRRFHAAEATRRQREHDAALDGLRVRFEVAERDRAIETLQSQRAQQDAALARRTLQLGLAVSAGLAALLIVALFWQRRQQRWRLERTRREAERQAEIAEFRRLAQSLAQDSSQLRTMLDASPEALLSLRPDGSVAYANAAAAQRLGRPAQDTAGVALAELLGAEAAATVVEELAQLEEGAASRDFVLTSPRCAPGTTWRAHLSPAADGASVVLRLGPDSEREAAPLTAASWDVDGAFRQALVELMLAAVEGWEVATRSTRIELAEQSRLWRVTVDDGRLRVRAMERYLSLAKLPRQPRWREVLRTGYFVLAECDLDATRRDALRRHCEGVNQLLRERATAAGA